MKVSLSNWYPGSDVGLIVSIPDLCPLSYFHVFPRDNIRKPFTLCITQSLNSQICFHLLYWIALFYTGPRSAVGNVSGYGCVSDCRSRGREFDPGPVPYFRGD